MDRKSESERDKGERGVQKTESEIENEREKGERDGERDRVRDREKTNKRQDGERLTLALRFD